MQCTTGGAEELLHDVSDDQDVDKSKAEKQSQSVLADLIEGINADILHEEVDFGNPIGQEEL